MFKFWKDRLIPAFLSFDVEPDGFQLTRPAPPMWQGYGAMFDTAEQLRSRLRARSGAAPAFGWYFRTDPQIAEVYGIAHSALAEFPERVAELKGQGDYFGVHAHPIRWSDVEHAWAHDVADTEWTAHCTRYALEAFARWQGSPALRFRAGGGYLSNTIIETLEGHGVKVDLSLEPVKGWWLYSTQVQTAIDSSPIIGKYTDCHTAPRIAYRPARENFRVAGGETGRSLVMIPHTTARVPLEISLWRRTIGRFNRQPVEEAAMLYPSIEWPSVKYFWDLVARHLQTMPKPYLSLGIRTDAPDSPLVRRVQKILEALPQHPLAERLRFADPVAVAPSLIGIA